MSKMTLKAIQESLELKGFNEGEALLLNQKIGGWVTHGGQGGKTVYASRIYQPGMRIQDTATNREALRKKIARAIHAAIKEDRFVPQTLN